MVVLAVQALVALKDGSIIAISEEMTTRAGANVGWIGRPAPGGRYDRPARIGPAPVPLGPARCLPRGLRGAPEGP